MTASTCTGTTFDTVLSLQVPSMGVASCADDDPTCGVQSKMAATLPHRLKDCLRECIRRRIDPLSFDLVLWFLMAWN
jgi:hypothetical protein